MSIFHGYAELDLSCHETHFPVGEVQFVVRFKAESIK